MKQTKSRDSHSEDSFGQSAIRYIKLARPDHWFKNVFVLPGFAFAVMSQSGSIYDSLVPLLLALVSTNCLVSANYVLNELLDASSDRNHPEKWQRPAAMGWVSRRLALVEYSVLAAAGLALAYQVNTMISVVGALLLVMGVFYNVPPVRTKDRVYLDVLSESVNNPLRFLIGWAVVIPGAFPPSSALLAFWSGGAFLMTAKRLAELRSIGNPGLAELYRASFRKWNEQKLIVAAFFLSTLSGFFTAIFLLKYRIEFILLYPAIAGLFTWYLLVALKDDSVVQKPEKLYREWKLALYVFLLVGIALALTYVDIPSLEVLLNQNEY